MTDRTPHPPRSDGPEAHAADDLPAGVSEDLLALEPALDLSALRDGPSGARRRPHGTRGEAAGDGIRWEALARRIDAAAAPELARRARLKALPVGTRGLARGRAHADVLPFIARAIRPVLLAAAAAVAIAVGLDRQTGEPTMPLIAAAPRDLVAGQLLSDGEAGWIAEQRAPSADDLARAIGYADADASDAGSRMPDGRAQP